MFFNRNKIQDEPAARVGLTDGIEAKIAEFVKDWGALQRGEREFRTDGREPPLQLLTDADVQFFTKAMEDELARVETYVKAEMTRQRNARVAQMDAEIAARNREIERLQALDAQLEAEVMRRGDRLADLRIIATKLAPGVLTNDMMERDIMRAVVRSQMGDAATVDEYSDEQVEARFDVIANNIIDFDPFQRAMMDRQPPLDGKALADKAWRDMVDDMTSAHRKLDETEH